MRYAVMLEKLPEAEGMPGYYYAHVPSLGLTTHGEGMEGALDAAKDLLSLWVDRRSQGESVAAAQEEVLASVEVD